MKRLIVCVAMMAGVAAAAEVAAGWTHSVAVRDGQVWTWGDNAYGQLGDGGAHDGTVAQRVSAFDEQTTALPRKPEARLAMDNQPPPAPFVNVREHGVKGDGIDLSGCEEVRIEGPSQGRVS